MNRIVTGILCLAINFFHHTLFNPFASAEDWPVYRGPDRNGISKEKDWSDQWPASGPTIAWRSKVGIGFSSVTIANGKLYTLGYTDDHESVLCLDAKTGQAIWKHDYEAPLEDRFFEGGPTSTPTIDGERLYSLSRQGELYCFEASSGKIIWAKNIQQEVGSRIPGWGFAASPVVHQEKLILGVGESGLAVDKMTGALLWKSGDGEAGYMTPLPFEINHQWHAMIASGKFYHCVDLSTGKVAWKHRWLTTYGCNAAAPIVSNNRVFLSSGYGRGSTLLEFNQESYKVLWSNKEMQNQFNSSLLIDGHLYGFDGDEKGGEEGEAGTGESSEERLNEADRVQLKCIDFETGKPRWSISGLGSGSLMAANDRLIVLSQSGELCIAPVSTMGFRPTARAKVLDGKCWTVPVLCNSLIYCRNASGDLVCIDVHSPTEK